MSRTVKTTTTTTRTTRPTLMSRLRGRKHRRAAPHHSTAHHGTAHHGTTHTTAARPGQRRRKVSLGDKVSGALLKLKGTLTHRPGQKAAGTRRMHGTDGRATHGRSHY
ncbi:MAG: hypothetical protein M1833_006111 [Piccolia ochrophora]|nr:MAG: hypothetical protein M1833_006111 [Piccolia ochrophora]